MVLRVHKVRPLDNEGKKKVFSNVVIARDGFEEAMLTLEDRASYYGRIFFFQTTSSY
jgi:hypothetical protein